jgi:serine/threonine protein kinase/WD40 repeat protein
MPDLVGQTLLSRYHIQDLVGRGGMAEVYKAWDAHRQYPVAVKVMREDLAEDLEFLRRFKREAKALAHLAHANVVRFYGFERAGRLAFIVMDYVEGTTLRGRILDMEGTPLPLDEAVSVARQVCAALHYAHTENVLHRDVKPGNIMIRPDGRVLVADFGIAKAADAATATTVMPGTPAYMSPEQCRSEVLDARTDVYSLGIVVYEMLAGQRPFVGDRAKIETGSTRERIRWEQMHIDPPPLRQFNPAVPPSVEAVVLQALAKHREARHPTVLAFRQALEGALGAKAAAEPRPVTEAPTEPEVAAPSPPVKAAEQAVPESQSVRAAEAVEEAKPEPQRSSPVIPQRRAAPVPAAPRVPGWAWAAGGVTLVAAAVWLLVGPGRGERPIPEVPAPTEPQVEAQIGSPSTESPQTPTPRPATRTPTLTPIPTPTPTPVLIPISPGNAAKVVELRTLTEDSAVHNLAFSPDGEHLASSDGSTVRLWQVADGSLMHELKGLPDDDGGRAGHPYAIGSIAFSPDGATLASGACRERNEQENYCTEGEIRLWRPSDGVLLGTLRYRTEWANVMSLAFSPGGTLLASGSCGHNAWWGGCDQGEVRIWSVPDGKLLHVLGGHTDWVNCLAFSPDGAILASGGHATYDDIEVRLWRVDNGALIHAFDGPLTTGDCSMSFSDNGTVVQFANNYGAVWRWDVTSGRLVESLYVDMEGVASSLAVSPDGEMIALGCEAGGTSCGIRLYRATDLELLKELDPRVERVSSLTWSPDAMMLACGGIRNTAIRLWGVPEE